MNRKCISKNMLRLVMILLLVICVVTGCGKNGTKKDKQSDAGYYRLYTMEAGNDSYDHETIVKYGLDSMTLILYEDGTASLAFANEVPTEMTWKKGVILDRGGEIPYTVENDMLTLVHNDETMLFEKVGNPPKKAEIQTPNNAEENRNN